MPEQRKSGSLGIIIALILLLISCLLPPPYRMWFGPVVIVSFLVALILVVLAWRFLKKLFSPIQQENTFFKGKPVLDGLSIKAVLVSTLANIALIFAVSLISGLGIFIYSKSLYGKNFDEQAFVNTVNSSLTLTVFLTISFAAIDIYSGYIAASIAARKGVLNGVFSQILLLLYGVCELINGPFYHPRHEWTFIPPLADNILLFLGPVLGGIGGHIRELRSKRAKL